jgi:hypothetical protein
MHRLCFAAAQVCLWLLGSAIVATAAPAAPGKALLHDTFEGTAVKDGVAVTQPATVVAGKASGSGFVTGTNDRTPDTTRRTPVSSFRCA